MRRSWAYVVNGFRLKLASGSSDERAAVRRAAEDFFSNPPQHLPIVEAKDNATSTSIEVCKIVQTAQALKLVQHGSARPKLLVVAGEWLLQNGYEAQTIRALATVLNCIGALEHPDTGDSIEFLQGKVSILRSAFQCILRSEGVDRETSTVGVLVSTAKSVATALRRVTQGLAESSEVCGSDEDFFGKLQGGVFSAHYYATHLEPFLISQLPTAVTAFIVQHKAAWLTLPDGLVSIGAALSALPPASQALAWESIATDVSVRVGSGVLSMADALSLLDAVSSNQNGILPEKVALDLSLLVEGVLRWISNTAGSDISSFRELRRLFASLAQVYGSKGPLAKHLDSRELFRLIDILRPRILQLSASNAHASELSLFTAALGRCQSVIHSQKDASARDSIVHVDVIRALITSMVANVKAVQPSSAVPFVSAIAQLIEREWRGEKARRMLQPLLVPRKVATGKRVSVPPFVRLLRFTRDIVTEALPTDQLSHFLNAALKVQSLLSSDESDEILIAVSPAVTLLRARKERLPMALCQTIRRCNSPLLEGLLEPESEASAQGGITDAAPTASRTNELKARLGDPNGVSPSDLPALIRLAAATLSSPIEGEDVSALGPQLVPIIFEQVHTLGIGDVSNIFTMLDNLFSSGCASQMENLMERANALVSNQGAFAAKGKLVNAMLHCKRAQLDSVWMGRILESLSRSVCKSLEMEANQKTSEAQSSISLIVSNLPPLSLLASAATRLQSSIQIEADMTSGNPTVQNAVSAMVLSIADYFDSLFVQSLESSDEEIPSLLIDVSASGIPPLISALRACHLRHKFHFTIMPDLHVLLRGAPPTTLLSVLRGFSQVGVWNNRSMAPICQTIEQSIVSASDAQSLRSAVSLLFNMARFGLITSDFSEEEPVGRLVGISCRKVGELLACPEIPLSDRSSVAKMALQPLANIGRYQDAERVAARLVWQVVDDVDAVECFVALATSQRLGGPSDGFTQVVRCMRAKGLLKELRPHTLEVVARCWLFAISEGPIDDVLKSAVDCDLLTAANAFQSGGTLHQFASSIYSLSCRGISPSAMEQLLTFGWERFSSARLTPQSIGFLATSIASFTSPAALSWKNRLLNEFSESPTGDIAAALLHIVGESDVSIVCQSLVSRRNSLSRTGAVWALAFLSSQYSSVAIAGGSVMPDGLDLRSRAAVTALQIIIAAPFDIALEGSFSSAGNGVCPPDSLLGSVRRFKLTGLNLKALVGEEMAGLFDLRMVELSRRSALL